MVYIDFQISQVLGVPLSDKVIVKYERVPMPQVKDKDQIEAWLRSNAFNPHLDKFLTVDNRPDDDSLVGAEFDIIYSIIEEA